MAIITQISLLKKFQTLNYLYCIVIMMLTQKVGSKIRRLKTYWALCIAWVPMAAILLPARIFNHRSFSVQPKYSKLHIYMCYYLFKHCAKLHEFNLSFSNNYFTFAFEIGCQQPLNCAHVAHVKSPQLHCQAKVLQIAHIYVLLFFQALCKITPINSNNYF